MKIKWPILYTWDWRFPLLFAPSPLWASGLHSPGTLPSVSFGSREFSGSLGIFSLPGYFSSASPNISRLSSRTRPRTFPSSWTCHWEASKENESMTVANQMDRNCMPSERTNTTKCSFLNFVLPKHVLRLCGCAIVFIVSFTQGSCPK